MFKETNLLPRVHVAESCLVAFNEKVDTKIEKLLRKKHMTQQELDKMSPPQASLECKKGKLLLEQQILGGITICHWVDAGDWWWNGK